MELSASTADVRAVARVSGSSDELVRLGQVIRAARKAISLTQEALADKSGIERAHMGKIERGERNVTMKNILRIAAALEIKASALLLEAGL